MTCIAAIVADGQVHMAADSCGSNGYTYTIHRNKKIFLVGELLIGFTTSFRMGQLLQHELDAPAPTEDLHRYMVHDFVEKVRELFRNKGFRPTDPALPCGNFLVAIRGRLFEVCHDFSVQEHQTAYAAIGSGSGHAQGSLFTTEHMNMMPHIRLFRALEAAEAHCVDVRRPFTYLETQRELGQSTPTI